MEGRRRKKDALFDRLVWLGYLPWKIFGLKSPTVMIRLCLHTIVIGIVIVITENIYIIERSQQY